MNNNDEIGRCKKKQGYDIFIILKIKMIMYNIKFIIYLHKLKIYLT